MMHCNDPAHRVSLATAKTESFDTVATERFDQITATNHDTRGEEEGITRCNETTRRVENACELSEREPNSSAGSWFCHPLDAFSHDVELKALNKDRMDMINTIAAQQMKIDAERKMREDVNKKVRLHFKDIEMLNGAQTKTLKNMAEKLNASNIEKLVANNEIEKLNSQLAQLECDNNKLKRVISTDKREKQSLEMLNSAQTKTLVEARQANEQADTTIKAQTKTLESMTANLKNMEANWNNESHLNNALRAQMDHLKNDIESAQAKQDDLDKQSRQVKEEAEKTIRANTDQLSKKETELKNTGSCNSARDAKIEKLNKSILEARAKQEALDKEAHEVKEQAEKEINAQKDALKKMESNWISESKENRTLKDQIAQLKNDIAAAKDEKQALESEIKTSSTLNIQVKRLESDNARLAEEAKAAREEGEARVNAKAETLKKMVEKWNDASEQNNILKSCIDQLTEDLESARAKRDELDEEARRVKQEAERTIRDKSIELYRKDIKLNSESEHNSALDARIKKLNGDIAKARAEQEARDAEARLTKERVEVKIDAQTAALETMVVRWTSESKENGKLKAQIARLTDNVEIASKAEVAKSEEEGSTQTNALNSMEAKLAQLESVNARLKRVASDDRREKQELIDAKAQLKRVVSDNRREKQELIDAQAQLKRVASDDRREKQELIDAKTRELERVEQYIEKLKESETQMKNELSVHGSPLFHSFRADIVPEEEDLHVEEQDDDLTKRGSVEGGGVTARAAWLESENSSAVPSESLAPAQEMKREESMHVDLDELLLGAMMCSGGGCGDAQPDLEEERGTETDHIKSDEAQLKTAGSTGSQVFHKTLDAQNESAEAPETSVREEVPTQQHIDSISAEIAVAQKECTEKLRVVRSMSVDLGFQMNAQCEDKAVEIEYEGGEKYAGEKAARALGVEDSAAHDSTLPRKMYCDGVSVEVEYVLKVEDNRAEEGVAASATVEEGLLESVSEGQGDSTLASSTDNSDGSGGSGRENATDNSPSSSGVVSEGKKNGRKGWLPKKLRLGKSRKAARGSK